MQERIVLAFSGNVDTTLAIPWLAERYDAEVVAVSVDLGQGVGLEDVRERALAAGAVRALVLDAQDEFAREYLLPALQAGGGPPQRAAAGPLGRQLIARKLLEVAAIEHAGAIAHGSATPPDRQSLDASVRELDLDIRIIAPAREWADARVEAEACARRQGVHVPRLIPAGPKPSAVELDTPACVEILFDRGVPVAVNGVAMELVELLDSLATIAAGHGVAALAPLRDALSAFGAATPAQRAGVVHVQLHGGACTVTSIETPEPATSLGAAFPGLTAAPL